ncbi:aldehyde oxidase [Pelagivirga sediminicola]|uniref:Aldehyde oxidase n=1 Tax=Pelagivirga sediminicola TaxID=2170575 RepID=A0A2T7G554_9RHOB|nr:xanthine dehydrogenase family protein molybdopterin-binding subunit [Pelagivirga sediminicola]PVA09562.1 aldehyde oxidase [Pelagivirga sediminicola]
MTQKLEPSGAVMDYPRRDAGDKVRGRTKYTVDQAGSDTLHAVLVRSDVAAGRIAALQVDAALAMPGVRAIATGEDAPDRHGLGIADHPIFASTDIRYHGEPILAIAADTLDQAKAAAAKVVLRIDPVEPVLTMAEALQAGARLIHPDWKDYEILFSGAARGGNIAWTATVERGDTDAAFARDDVTIVEGCYRVGRQNHVSFEPRAVVASFEDGRYHIVTSTQAPWTVKNVTAMALGISPSQVRVTVPPVGGGFGLKFDCSLEPYAAILARKTGQKVSLINSREEEMLTCLSRENAEIRLRSAVTPEGEIAAREGTVLMDCGAYGGEQVFLTTMTAHTLGGNYRLGATKIASHAVYTNTAPNGAFRACNGVYNTFALERHTDEICAAIGMDPMEFRKRNVVGDGSLGATGQVFQGDVLKPMLERMERLIGADPQPEIDPDRYLYGQATTVGTWFIFVGPSAASVILNADGSATLVTSGVEIGSGTMMQSLPQMVAAELGIHPDKVIVKTADTDASGRDLGVGGGRTTVSIGAASTAACAEVRQKLLSVASEMLQTPVSKLVLGNGRIEIAGRAGSGMTIQTVIAEAEVRHGPISGSGAFTAPGTPSMPGCAAGHFIDAIDIPVFAVHNCDIAIEKATGRISVLNYRVVQDVGRAINPRAIKSQVQGGVVQGLGYALHEEMTINGDGCIDQSGFETYKIPGVGDAIPITLEMFEGAPSIGPLGTKGAGEVPILNVGATIACAVANATGKQVNELPLVPPRVLDIIENETSGLDLVHIHSDWRRNV